MDSQHRKDLKTDKFAEEVGHTWEFLAEHRKESVRYGVIGVVVIVIAVGIYAYTRHQASAREQAFTKTVRIADAVISATPHLPDLNFPTQDAKDQALLQAYMDLATQYHGTQEGATAQLRMASMQIEKGKTDEAEKIYKDIIDSAPAPYASVAQLALADIYAGEGKIADAEKLLRSAMDKPTVFVSKEEAQLELAGILAKSNPTEAKKLLDPLRQSPRSAVVQAAVAQLGTMNQPAN